MAKTIAIDFDGVIHKYSNGWQDGEIYDNEIEGCFETIKSLMDDGYCVFILSTRSPDQIKSWLLPRIMISEYERDGVGNDPNKWVDTRFGYKCKVIKKSDKFWNEKYVLGITNRKLVATVYLDDRAMIFNGSWGDVATRIKSFKTHQEQG